MPSRSREMIRLEFTSPLEFRSAATVWWGRWGPFCSSYSLVSTVIYPQSDLSLTLFFFSKCHTTTGGEYETIFLPLTFNRQSTVKCLELTVQDASKVAQSTQTQKSFLQMNLKWNANCIPQLWLWIKVCNISAYWNFTHSVIVERRCEATAGLGAGSVGQYLDSALLDRAQIQCVSSFHNPNSTEVTSYLIPISWFLFLLWLKGKMLLKK